MFADSLCWTNFETRIIRGRHERHVGYPAVVMPTAIKVVVVAAATLMRRFKETQNDPNTSPSGECALNGMLTGQSLDSEMPLLSQALQQTEGSQMAVGLPPKDRR